MFYLFYPKNTFDASPFQFQEANWLRQQVRQIYGTYLEYKRNTPGRVKSNHLLITILTNITSEFDGDIIKYMQAVDQESRRIAGPMGLTTASTRGDLFSGVFYSGVPEVITVSRGIYRPLDLWWDWRKASPVTVSAHPVTSLTLFDPIVENAVNLSSSTAYAQINIDIPLLAAQFKMYKANYPSGTMEQYIAQIVVPAMMQSHLDIVLFNQVCVKLGTMEATSFKTNLPFAQPSLDVQSWKLAESIVAALRNRTLTERQILSTIPTLYSTDQNALYATKGPSILLNAQTVWVLHSQAVMKAEMVLKVCEDRNNYVPILPLTIKMKRDMQVMVQEGWYSNGLAMDTRRLLMSRWERAFARLPVESMESVEVI